MHASHNLKYSIPPYVSAYIRLLFCQASEKGYLDTYIFTKNLHSLLNQTTYTEANERLQP